MMFVQKKQTGNRSHGSAPQHDFDILVQALEMRYHCLQVLSFIEPESHILPLGEPTAAKVKNHKCKPSVQDLFSMGNTFDPRAAIAVQIQDDFFSLLELLEQETAGLDSFAEFIPQREVLARDLLISDQEPRRTEVFDCVVMP